MSEGPIKRWRDSYLPPKVSTTNKDRVCMASPTKVTRMECGRTGRRPFAIDWAHVTCADCLAAHAADVEIGGHDA